MLRTSSVVIFHYWKIKQTKNICHKSLALRPLHETQYEN